MLENIISPKISKQRYRWEGIDRQGNFLQGETSAFSSGILQMELRQQGINVRKIRREFKPHFLLRYYAINATMIAIFLRQLATLVAAGIPLTQSLNIIASGQACMSMKNLLLQLKQKIETGEQLSETLSQFSYYFTDICCRLIYVGEKTGELDRMLIQVADYQEKLMWIKAKIKKAIFYPIVIMSVALLVTLVLLVYVVPEFANLFNSVGATLPLMTRGVIAISTGIQKQGYLFLLAGVMITAAWMGAKRHSNYFAEWCDKALLSLPISGTILRKAIVARFARTLSTTFAAGLPLVSALEVVAKALGNSFYVKAIEKSGREVATGQPLNNALRTSCLFPAMVLQMIAIGEASGTLEMMLGKIADFYEAEVDHSLNNLTSLLEPLLMVFLGLLVGGLIIAMYLPIFKLGTIL